MGLAFCSFGRQRNTNRHSTNRIRNLVQPVGHFVLDKPDQFHVTLLQGTIQ